MAEEKSDGTSAFGASLREILLGGPGPQGSLSARIRDRQVCLIDEDGKQLGVVSTKDALLMAQQEKTVTPHTITVWPGFASNLVGL
jgi:hypothetical protein